MSEMFENREVTETTETFEAPVMATANEPESVPAYGAENQYPAMDTSTLAKFFAGGMVVGSGVTAVTVKLVNSVKEKLAKKETEDPPVKVKKEFHLQLPWRIDKVPVKTDTPAEDNDSKPEKGNEETK